MWQIDKFSRIPIYEQVVNLVERFVLQGILHEDEQMPSVRILSQSMGINPNTLQKAYAELERRGICYSVPGSGRYVCAEAKKRLSARKTQRLEDLRKLVGELMKTGVTLEEMAGCIQSIQVELTGANTQTISAPTKCFSDGSEEK